MRTHVPPPAQPRPTSAEAIFEHIVVGIDDTPESLVGAAQASALRAPRGRIVLVAVAERYLAAHAGLAAGDAGDRVVAGTSDDLARARELVDADDEVMASGRLVDLLCAECSRREASLVVVGVRPHGRLAALTFGGHDVDVLHDARCSVLIARPGWGPHRPDRIVVAVDGSPESQAAETVARPLADRLGCELVPVVGLADADAAVLRAERDDAVLEPGPLVDAVVAAASRQSLVVAGRGGRSERIVHRARCSVLAVEHRPALPA